MSRSSRRTFLGQLAAAPILALGCRRAADAAVCAPTPADIEGPFFKEGAPRRAQLADSKTPGRPLRLSGSVVGPDCRPISGAVIEIWQADHQGAYDNAGHRFRATVPLPAGRFDIRTIVPGRYLNGRQYRPAHIHVKVRAEGFAPLTTQLYFPGDPYNRVDPWFKPSLLVRVDKPRQTILESSFRFALAK